MKKCEQKIAKTAEMGSRLCREVKFIQVIIGIKSGRYCVRKILGTDYILLKI